MNDVEFDYWAKFYNRFKNTDPSPFCRWALPRIWGAMVFDVGCGNGRDTEKIAEALPVMGIDPHAPSFRAEFRYHQITIEDFMPLVPCSPVDTVYARWFFHSVEEQVEDAVLDWTKGQLLVESRAYDLLEDPPDDHYVRPLNPDAFVAKIEKIGFNVDYYAVDRGWSMMGEEDPLLMRVEAHR